LKYLGGQVLFAEVKEIHCQLVGDEEWEPEAEISEEDFIKSIDVDNVDVELPMRRDKSLKWEFGADALSHRSSWFQCAYCSYELAFEDGRPVEDEDENFAHTLLAEWLLFQSHKKSQ
jgi:hypothetical protein